MNHSGMAEFNFQPETRHQKKYMNFHRMLLKIREDVNSGKVKPEAIVLNKYASMYTCCHLYESQLYRVLNIKDFTFDNSVEFRDEITALTKKQKEEKSRYRELNEDDCIAFLKSKGYKVQRKVVTYEDC